MGVVRTADGVRLHVEVTGRADAGLTVVLSHGFTATLDEWVLQREVLEQRVRVVAYDQRGHGRSDRSHWEHATIDQLGRDLQAVLEATCPTGPVVLAGHSMGGMTVLSWARQFPHEVGARVVGAFLLATSAGDLVTHGPLGRAVRLLSRLHLLGAYLTLLRLLSPLVQRVRRPGTHLGYRWVRHYLFGTDDADDTGLVRMVQEMLESCDFRTSAAFYPAFLTHDERAALPVLARVPTTVLCGTADRLTPVSHSRAMAQVLGGELVEVPGCGHSVNVTRPELVNDALLALVARAGRTARAAG